MNAVVGVHFRIRRLIVGLVLLAVAVSTLLGATPVAQAADEPSVTVDGGSINLPDGPADYVVRGANLPANAPFSLLQCRDVGADPICGQINGGGTTTAAGEFVQGAMSLGFTTKAFATCPAGQCYIRATNAPFYSGAVVGDNTFGTTGDISRCPAGTVMTGIEGDTSVEGFGTIVRSAAPVCGATVASFVGSSTMPIMPNETVECDPGDAVTGMSGRAGNWIDQLALHCSDVDGAGVPTTPPANVGFVGGVGGGAVGLQPCPTGMTAVGLDGIDGGLGVTFVRLLCEDPVTPGFDVRTPLSFASDPTPLSVDGLFLQAAAAPQLPGARTIPTGAIPASAIPAENVPFVASVPLRSIDLEASPLRSIPLRSIPLRSIPLRSIPLRSIPLSSIPLRSIDGGWAEVLTGTPLAGLPLQTVTLHDVVLLPNADDVLGDLTIEQADLSATPLRSISILSLALGSTPLRSIPLRSIDGAPAYPDNGDGGWCAYLASLNDPALTCAVLEVDGDSPIAALDLAGVPLRSIPLRSIPLRSIDLATAPLRSIPLRSIAIANTPLRSIPLRSIDLAAAPLRSIPLRSIGNVDEIVDCDAFLCSALNVTLGDAGAFLLPDVTLGELVASLDEEGLDELGELGDLLESITDANLDLGDVRDILVGLLLAGDFPWEELPLDKMGAQRFAPAAEKTTFLTDYSVVGGLVASDHTVTLTLPKGFAYVPRTAAVSIGATTTSREPVVSDNPRNGEVLTWEFENVPNGTDVVVDVDAANSLRLGDAGPATVLVEAEEGSTFVSDSAMSSGQMIEQAGDPDFDDPVAASVGDLELGYITGPDDVDYYTVPAPAPGARLSIRLSHLSSDADLVLYSPAGADAEEAPSTAPLRSIPLRSIPLEDEQLADQIATPETLQDIPLRSIPLRSISANRSAADETINVTSTAPEGGEYKIQVSGYNGATSDDPYVLRVQTTEPPAAPTCANPLDLTGIPAGTRSADRSDAQTLILLNQQRLTKMHAADAANVRAKLDALAAHDNVKGVVVPVETMPDVADAFAAWDQASCSPEKANAVVSAITTGIRSFAGSHPDLRNVVVVGADDLLPMARVADTTRLSNERDYAGETGGPNPITGAFATEHILTDDPYGDLDPVPWLDRQLYVPDLAVGRLVESPAEIVGQIDQFLSAGGVLSPDTALTSGYDFLTDGAQAVDRALAKGITSRRTLINEQWNRTNLVDELFNQTSDPDIASVNAHFDHHRSLPALGNATQREDDLFEVGDVPTGTPAELAGRLLFSMGCHAGLSLPDRYVGGSGTGTDWAQTIAGQQAVFVANTGFGYGDTAAVALSERLMALFAGGLWETESIGAALAEAKSEYFASLGLYGAYDEKALMEATFYGLPMYRIAGATPVAEPAPAALASSTDTVLVDTDLDEVTTPTGSYWTQDGDVQVTHYRPIQPKTSVDVTKAGEVAHGAVIENLTSTDVAGVNPVFARPVVDHSAAEPEISTAGAIFPSTTHTISTVGSGADLQQRLVLLPGQFIGSPSNPNTGVQRLFDDIEATVYYGAETDEQVAPTFEQIEAVTDGSEANFQASVHDTSGVERVLVLFHDDSGDWTPVELLDPDLDGVWRGSAPAVGDEIDYFVQAVDTVGNTAESTNKGRYFEAEPFAVDVPPADGANGWYTGPVSLIVSGAEKYRIDGGDWNSVNGPIIVTGDGEHTVGFANAHEAPIDEVAIPIDGTPPTIQGTTPADGASFVKGESVTPDYTCDDDTSLIATCTVPDVETSTAGSFGYEVVAVDVAGNRSTVSLTYEVTEATATFEGFKAPVDNARANVMKAGAAVAVKWSLPKSDGTFLRDTAGIIWGSHPVGCGSAATDGVEQTVLASGSGLKYDAAAEQYVLTWKTDKSWQSCRRLTLFIPDVGYRTALFQFK